uniref:Uncharacterized protein n=2 Tax=Aegilops tauschii TaxID=37682 RepID=R7W1Q5_AEGTA
MEEAEKGEILEWNTKPSSMEEAEKGEIFERNTKLRLDDHPQATAMGVASLFNVDLILDILSRLPARSVHRFKCVSVLWRDLIADPANHKKLPQTLDGFLYTTFCSSGYRHHFAGFSGGAASFDPSLPYLHPNKGAWIHRDSGIVEKATLFRSKCVFVGGMLYIMGNLEDINGEYVLVGVDMEGKVWKTIRVPYGSKFGTIGLSQGCLHYAVAPVNNNNEILVSEIALWCLKDCDSKQWVLKHTASIDTLMSMTEEKYRVVEIHPDCDTIFLARYGGDTLVSYDMWHQKVGCIINLEKNSVQKFLPYVPVFSEPLADAEE